MEIIKFHRDMKDEEKLGVSVEAAREIMEKGKAEMDMAAKLTGIYLEKLAGFALYRDAVPQLSDFLGNALRSGYQILSPSMKSVSPKENKALTEIRRKLYQEIAGKYGIRGVYVD